MLSKEVLYPIIEMAMLPISIIIFLFMLLYLSNSFGTDISHKFRTPIYLLLCLCVCDITEKFLIQNEINNLLHQVVTYCGYHLRLCIMLSIIYRSIREYRIKYKHLLSIPALLSMIICSSAFFTHWVFWFEGTEIQRGPLSLTPHLTAGLYSLVMLIICLYKVKIGKRDEALFLGIALTISMVSMVVETITHIYGMLLGALALDVLGYYLLLYLQHYNYDPLTGLLNRESFNTYMNLKRNKVKAVFSIDMNNLKQINDTYGHMEGDEALKTIASTLQKQMSKNCYLFRIGGDEFTILVLDQHISIEFLTKRIERAFQKSKYTIAIGSARVTPIQDVENAYKIADAIMYANKKKMKDEMRNREEK